MNGAYITALFLTASHSYHLPPKLLNALCWVESRHNVAAINKMDGHSDSIGICQIKVATAKLVGYTGGANWLQKPSININYAAAYLHKQLVRYDGDIPKAISAYNAGRYLASEDGKIKNLDYVSKVLKAWGEQR